MRAPFFDHQHRRKAPAKSITNFQEAIRSQASDISQDDAAPMQLREDFLVDSGVLIRLATINDSHLVTKLIFNDGLHNRLEEILNICVVCMSGVEEPDGESFGPLERLKKVDESSYPLRDGLSRCKIDSVDPRMCRKRSRLKQALCLGAR